MADKVLIKKYPNRRLYDTEKSTYVTLTQVSDMIRAGRQVEVIDAKTEENVTAFILTQIVLEQAKNRNLLLPEPLLHLIIRYGDGVLNDFFENYLELTIKNYLSYKTALDEHFKNWLEIGADFSNLAHKNIPAFSPLTSFLDLFADAAKRKNEKQ